MDSKTAKNGNVPALANENSKLPSNELARCPHCGEEIRLYTIYCPKCGKNCFERNLYKRVVRLICPHCSTPNEAENTLCSYCFFSLASAKQEDFQVGLAQNSRTNDTSANQLVLKNQKSEDSKLCSNCGALNKYDQLYCYRCGVELLVENLPKYCLSCGWKNPPDSRFCGYCQARFKDSSQVEKDTWVCKCGHTALAEDAFCEQCGMARPNSGSLDAKEKYEQQ